MRNPKLLFFSILTSIFSSSFGIDKRSLGLFRIALALVLIYDLFVRTTDMTAFYSDGGVLPRAAHLQLYSDYPYWFSVHMLTGSVLGQSCLFCYALVCALALLVGYRTRWATLFSWLLLISLHNRNPMVIQGGDILLRMLLFWGLFLPLEARFSLDRLFGNTSKNLNEPQQGIDPARVVTIGSFAVLLQVSFVYWFSAALKSDAAWTTDGTAIYYALSIDQMVKPLGRTLLGYPEAMRQLTFLTLALERFGPLLVLLPFWRLRLGMAAVFIGFHIALALCLTLGIFSYISVVAWLLFIPTPAWDALAQRMANLPMGRLSRLRNRASTFYGGFAAKRELSTAKKATVTPRFAALQTRINRGLKPVSATVAGLALLYVFGWNMRTVDKTKYGSYLPAGWNVVGQLTRIDQRWGMFAPYPLKDDGWMLAPAQLANGMEVDLLTDDRAVNWQKPDNLSATFKDALWQKYLLNLWPKSNRRHRRLYANYLTRQWNQSHGANEQIKSLQLIYMREDTLTNETAPPRKVVLWKRNY